tara:strand:+ start:216 stop:482 length:267 start_codon:yes stop_codon:yes gene_type:complete
MIKIEGKMIRENTLINLQESYAKLQWQKKNNFPDKDDGTDEAVTKTIEENFDSIINEIEVAIDNGYDFMGIDEDGIPVFIKSSEINLQ